MTTRTIAPHNDANVTMTIVDAPAGPGFSLPSIAFAALRLGAGDDDPHVRNAVAGKEGTAVVQRFHESAVLLGQQEDRFGFGGRHDVARVAQHRSDLEEDV